MGGETGGKGESFHQRPAAAHLLEAMSSGLLGWALEPARHRHGHGHRYLVCLSDELVVHSDPRPHVQQPTRLPRPWDSPGKKLEWVAISSSRPGCLSAEGLVAMGRGLRGSSAGTLGVPLGGTRRVGGLLGVAP